MSVIRKVVFSKLFVEFVGFGWVNSKEATFWSGINNKTLIVMNLISYFSNNSITPHFF